MSSPLHIVYPSIPCSRELRLGDLHDGEVFAFQDKIHQHLGPKDVCMVVYMNRDYRSQQEKHSDKTTVVNLSKSRVSLICPTRSVRRLNAKLVAEDA